MSRSCCTLDINKPWFERDKWYAFSEMRSFEEQLLHCRRSNPDLSKQWRAPDASPNSEFIKLRNEELIPARIFADHKGLSKDGFFMITPPGDQIDIKVKRLTAEDEWNLQITVCNPSLNCDPGENAGYQSRLKNELMNKQGEFAGVGRLNPKTVRKWKPDQASLVGESYTTEKCHAAYERDIIGSLERKSNHDGRGYWLLVFVKEFHQHIDNGFDYVVDAAFRKVTDINFYRVCFFDEGGNNFIEKAPVG